MKKWRTLGISLWILLFNISPAYAADSPDKVVKVGISVVLGMLALGIISSMSNMLLEILGQKTRLYIAIISSLVCVLAVITYIVMVFFKIVETSKMVN